MIISFTGKKNSGKNTAATMLQFIAKDLEFEVYKHCVDAEEDTKTFFKEWSKAEGIKNPLIQSEDKFELFFEEKSFASKVKDVCSIITGLPRENFDDRELRDVEIGIKELENPHVIKLFKEINPTEMTTCVKSPIPNYTYRTLMQRVGTEAMRDMIHQNIWVNALMQEYKWDGKTLTNGWVPSYNDPDNSGCHPNAEPIYPNWLITDLRFNNEAQAVIDKGGYVIQINRDDVVTDTHASEQPVHPEFVFMYVGNYGTLEELYKKLQNVYLNIQHDRKRKNSIT